MRIDELIKEAYEDRVADTAERVIARLNGTGTLSDIKKAIHDIASPNEDSRITNLLISTGQQKGPFVKNGIPDYNGSLQARNEFIADVVNIVKHHIAAPKRPPTGAAARYRHPNLSSDQIWNKFQMIVSDVFPDGDPMDRMQPWMKRNDVSLDNLNFAVRQHSDFKSYDEYLASFWDEMSTGAIEDAMDGHYGETYDGEWFTRSNPWK